jgi:hypothetical protein
MAGARTTAAAKISAVLARSGCLRFPEDACDMIAPFDDAHPMMPTAGQTPPNLPGSGRPGQNPSCQAGGTSRSRDGTFWCAFY